MGRKQAFTPSQLLDETERLLLIHGYKGFHLKLLSEHLQGARSTIYLYYGSKEEIVAACMKRAMDRMLVATRELDESNTMNALKSLLHIYISEGELHQIMRDINKIDLEHSEAARRDISYVRDSHLELKDQLNRLFQSAQQEGYIRTDIPMPVISGIFFSLIDSRNVLNLPSNEWADMLFNIWLQGSKAQKE